MNYNPSLNLSRLQNLISRLQIPLTRDDSLPPTGAVLYNEKSKSISYRPPENSMSIPVSLVLMLAHGLGHWWSYEMAPEVNQNELSPEHLDLQAERHGWHILCLVEANEWVSREQWAEINRKHREDQTRNAPNV